MSSLLEGLTTTDALAGVFADRHWLDAMGQFEIALARAQARCGVIPDEASSYIAEAADVSSLDVDAIVRDARRSGTMAIAFVDQLRLRVGQRHAASATYVHWGATSQDVTDTALVLCLRRALAVLEADHRRLMTELGTVSDQHAHTVMLARTLLQPAAPTTFGLKAAGWFAACGRSWARVTDAFRAGLVLQFGGAAGTLAAFGADGERVAAELARELDLPVPDAPWHAHRDRLAAIVAACGIYSTALAKIARDLALLMQAEVAEVSAPGGASSSMPHKRNPAGCGVALAAAARVAAMVSAHLTAALHEHERGLGGASADAATVAATVQAVGAALHAMADVAGSLQVDRARMRLNIVATRGVVFAERAMLWLAPRVGRDRARQAIAEALDAVSTRGATFAQALAAVPGIAAALTADELVALEVPESYLGAAEAMRRRLLASRGVQ